MRYSIGPVAPCGVAAGGRLCNLRSHLFRRRVLLGRVKRRKGPGLFLPREAVFSVASIKPANHVGFCILDAFRYLLPRVHLYQMSGRCLLL